MRKLLASVCILVMMASVIPAFAEDTTNNTTSTPANNTTNNTTLAPTNNTTSTLEQLGMDLMLLIAKIDKLIETHEDIKAKGLLIALKQFRKQAIRLNNEINAFIGAPMMAGDPNENDTALIANKTSGRINSFVKREAALKKKVAVKERILLKNNQKQEKQQQNNCNECNCEQNQNKHQNKNKNGA